GLLCTDKRDLGVTYFGRFGDEDVPQLAGAGDLGVADRFGVGDFGCLDGVVVGVVGGLKGGGVGRVSRGALVQVPAGGELQRLSQEVGEPSVGNCFDLGVVGVGQSVQVIA